MLLSLFPFSNRSLSRERFMVGYDTGVRELRWEVVGRGYESKLANLLHDVIRGKDGGLIVRIDALPDFEESVDVKYRLSQALVHAEDVLVSFFNPRYGPSDFVAFLKERRYVINDDIGGFGSLHGLKNQLLETLSGNEVLLGEIVKIVDDMVALCKSALKVIDSYLEIAKTQKVTQEGVDKVVGGR
ncbi:MAG: hypothetical protein WC873_02115 [Candidatus Gracilibacteria bacterium]